MTEWARKSFGTELKQGQRVRARLCSFKSDERDKVVEGTVMQDMALTVEVLEIDVDGVPTMVFYPDEVAND